MTHLEQKSAYELFYLVKGHLKPFTDTELALIYKDYSQRLWWNEEAHLYSAGFDQAWQQFLEKFPALRCYAAL